MKNAIWIAADNGCLVNWKGAVNPAPLFRKEFFLDTLPMKAQCSICGLGFYELYLNGRKVGDHVLDPVFTQYDKRALFVRYDLTGYLTTGMNVVGIVLGNGWYNSHTPDVWHFDKATWRDYPKLLFKLDCDGVRTVVSDRSWRSSTGGITFDGVRNGESFDARLEQPGWSTRDFDAASWKPVKSIHGPGGLLAEQTQPPCKVIETIPAVIRQLPGGVKIADLGVNITGWARITVKGKPGDKITLRYGERVYENGALDIDHISKFQPGIRFQTDEYIVGSEEEESWEPRFAYHGFQYIEYTGEAELLKLEGRFVATAFESIGSLHGSDERLNKLHAAIRRGYLGNFTGIPTDCPHREKNGWTADAHLSAEFGLCNFDAGSAYNQWLDAIADAQRPDGQLPGIVPTAGWGFNWGSGPAWDSALLLIPDYVYDYTGDTAAIRKHYDAMRRYVDYCTSREEEGLIAFGLGDWAALDASKTVPMELVSTAFHRNNCRLLSRFASLLGKTAEAAEYKEHGQAIAAAFNDAFRTAAGEYGDRMSAYGIALYYQLVPENEVQHTADKLAAIVRERDCYPEYGIIGNKTILRALSDHGHVETAYKLLTRPDYPSFFDCLRRGATTLWGNWRGDASLNHIMYSDVGAWCFHSLGGLRMSAGKCTLAPQPVRELEEFAIEHRGIFCGWKRQGDALAYTIRVPSVPVELKLPGKEPMLLQPGHYSF